MQQECYYQFTQVCMASQTTSKSDPIVATKILAAAGSVVFY